MSFGIWTSDFWRKMEISHYMCVVTMTFSGVMISAPFAVAAPLNISSTIALNASSQHQGQITRKKSRQRVTNMFHSNFKNDILQASEHCIQKLQFFHRLL